MTALLVPICLDVLLVRPPDADRWAETAARPLPRVTEPAFFDPAPDPFAERAARPPGAYLHWALPDGLTAARPPDGAADDAEPVFPPIPDRWLIVRLSGDASTGPRAVRGWLLPDTGAQTATSLAVLPVTDPMPVIPAAGPVPEKPVTALGPGDLSWAAYYDNVEGRLAFHDDLGDLPAAGGASEAIAYLVVGWYTSADADPLADAANDSAAAALLDRLRWQADLVGTGATYPLTTVCHGSAVALGWPTPSWPGDGGILGTEADATPSPATTDLALGETVAEAVAALSIPGGAPDPALPRLLEALALGALRELHGPDGPAALDSTVHLSRFTATPSETDDEWIWQPDPATAPANPTSGQFVGATRAQPRVFSATDLALVVRGAGRSGKHGEDGRFDPDDLLRCRLEGTAVTAFGVEGGDPGLGADAVQPDVLDPVLTAYAVPAVAADLLLELGALDPGSARDRAAATPDTPSPLAAARARFWLTWDAADPGGVLTGTTHTGVLPSPVAVTAPTRPWNPLHADWDAEYLASTRGVHDWSLEDLDFAVPAEPDLAGARRVDLSGRIPLTAAPATALTAAGEGVMRSIRALADTGAHGIPRAGTAQAVGALTEALTGVADTLRPGRSLSAGLAAADLLSGALTGVTAQLRGDPSGVVVLPPGAPPDATPPLPSRPAGFVALRAGFLRLRRLRLVDTFGRVVDVLDRTDRNGAETTPRAFVVGASLAVPGRADLVGLRPRFTAPGRVLLRYSDALAPPTRPVDAVQGRSPLCGFLLPSPLDGSIEVFDADGANRGRLLLGPEGAARWEEAPGTPAALGVTPSSVIPNTYLGRFCDGLLAADLHRPPEEQSALVALLRIIDATRWTVDLTGGAGDEHLSLLVGSPVAVLRASIKLDVQDPRRPHELGNRSVPAKLGTLTHLQDGLLAYVVDDDYGRVRAVDPAVLQLAPGLPNGDGPGSAPGAAPVTSGYIDPDGTFGLTPGLPRALTLLAVPLTDVHVTTGLLPQKAVGMVRSWTGRALSRMSPTWRHGPLLLDRRQARVPVPTDLHGTWSWHHRTDPSTWASEDVVPATATALLPDDPALVNDGWLQVLLGPDQLFPGASLRVRAITKPFRDQPARSRITWIGGFEDDGTRRWKLPIDSAIAAIESGRFLFYIGPDFDEAHGVPLVVGVSEISGRKFLQSSPNAQVGDNLLDLPEIDF